MNELDVADNVTSQIKDKFPKIQVKDGYKAVNVDIMVALVVRQSASVYKVDGRKSCNLLVYYCQQVVLTELVSKSKKLKLLEIRNPKLIGAVTYTFTLSHCYS